MSHQPVKDPKAGYSSLKMQAAIQFFCSAIRNGTLGRTKLAKLFYFLDFDHYEQYGASVTGATYAHFPRGPYPRQMMHEVRNLLSSQTLTETPTVVGSHVQYTYAITTLKPETLGVFTPSELLVLSHVATIWEKHTAKEMVDAIHGEAPWIATADGEDIPYAYAHYRRKFEPVPDSEEEGSPPELISVES